MWLNDIDMCLNDILSQISWHMWLITCKYNQIVGICGGYCIYDFINYAIKKLTYVVQQLRVNTIKQLGIVFMILLIMQLKSWHI